MHKHGADLSREDSIVEYRLSNATESRLNHGVSGLKTVSSSPHHHHGQGKFAGRKSTTKDKNRATRRTSVWKVCKRVSIGGCFIPVFCASSHRRLFTIFLLVLQRFPPKNSLRAESVTSGSYAACIKAAWQYVLHNAT